MCDGPTRSGPGDRGEFDAAARESAVALLAAADAVVDAHPCRSSAPEIRALADAAWMFAMARTAARWSTRPARERILVLVSGATR